MKQSRGTPWIQKFGLLLAILVLVRLCACDKQEVPSIKSPPSTETYYVLNTNSKKIHQPDCGTGGLIHEKNRKTYYGSMESLLQKGYTTCGNCFP